GRVREEGRGQENGNRKFSQHHRMSDFNRFKCARVLAQLAFGKTHPKLESPLADPGGGRFTMERMNRVDKAWRCRPPLAARLFAVLGALVSVQPLGAADSRSCSESCDRKAADCVDACDAKHKDDKPRVECKIQCATDRQKCESACPAPAPSPAPS